MEYRRLQVEGGWFFVTVVTHRRRPILARSMARAWLRQSIREVRKVRPFAIRAMVLLPEHWHAIIELPQGDDNLSGRINGIKRGFTTRYLAGGGREAPVSAGAARKRSRGVWQGRFWDHALRDAGDFKMHLDYIHANPVKHGLVARPGDWKWSSFARYVRAGEYPPDWCARVDLPDAVEYYWAD